VNLQTQLMAQLLEADLVGPLAEMVLELDQQKIVRLAHDPRTAEGRGWPDARWSWYRIGPAELKGEFEIEPVGQSTMPTTGPRARRRRSRC
jgi:hypothetical protein